MGWFTRKKEAPTNESGASARPSEQEVLTAEAAVPEVPEDVAPAAPTPALTRRIGGSALREAERPSAGSAARRERSVDSLQQRAHQAAKAEPGHKEAAAHRGKATQESDGKDLAENPRSRSACWMPVIICVTILIGTGTWWCSTSVQHLVENNSPPNQQQQISACEHLQQFEYWVKSWGEILPSDFAVKSWGKHLQQFEYWVKSCLSTSVRYLCSDGGSTNYVFIGNPGTGKSTLLNALAGEVLFNSGISYDGSGVSKRCEKKLHGEATYIDTPGLSDISQREDAANSIYEALSSGGSFKVVFVLALESGRIRPDDVTTIQLVLQSAPISHYGIIINKVSQTVKKSLNVDSLKNNLLMMLPGVTHPDMILLNPEVPHLTSEDNKLWGDSKDHTEFRNFVHEQVRAVHLNNYDVKPINILNYRKMEEEQMQIINTLNEKIESLKTQRG